MVQTSQRKLERELLRPEPGSDNSNILPVSILKSGLTPCVCALDHAHPTDVAGHPFKGFDTQSCGYLLHPDMKRFQIQTPVLFAPPNPEKVVGAVTASASFPSFGSFFSSYFGGSSYSYGKFSDGNCQKMLGNLKKCYENSTSRGSNPENSCSFYLDGFKRMACNV